MTLPVISATRRTVLALAGGAALSALAPTNIVFAASRVGGRALAFDGDRLLAAGNGLARSDDDGRTWRSLAAPDGIHALAAHPARPGRILAGLAEGGVVVSEDSGVTWRSRTTGLASGEISAIAVAAAQPDIFYAAVRGDGLWKTEDAGASWTFVMDRPWQDDAERDPLALTSVNLETGMGGIWIYAGTEAGLTRVPDCFCRWQVVQPGNAMDALVSGEAPPSAAPLPAGAPVLALVSAPSRPETLYAALHSGLWGSQDGGVVWARLAAGDASAVTVHPADENYVVAAFGGDLKLSRDGGATWAALAV